MLIVGLFLLFRFAGWLILCVLFITATSMLCVIGRKVNRKGQTAHHRC